MKKEKCTNLYSKPLTKTHQKKKINAYKCTNASPSNVSDRQTFFLYFSIMQMDTVDEMESQYLQCIKSNLNNGNLSLRNIKFSMNSENLWQI